MRSRRQCLNICPHHHCLASNYYIVEAVVMIIIALPHSSTHAAVYVLFPFPKNQNQFLIYTNINLKDLLVLNSYIDMYIVSFRTVDSRC